MGLFASPNRAAVMNSLPSEDRGAGGAMNQTFQNSAQVLSIGIFFTLMIIGLASTLPETMSAGLQAHGVPPATAEDVAALPPVSILFAAFLGYNPVEHLVGAQSLAGLSAHDHAIITGHTFFPGLIAGPFRDGLHAAFLFAIVACLVAAAASFMRGERPVRGRITTPSTGEATCKLSGTDSPRSASPKDGQRSSSTRSTASPDRALAASAGTTPQSPGLRRTCCWSRTSTATTTASPRWAASR